MAGFVGTAGRRQRICELICKSRTKLRNKGARIKGRRSKGISQGLLREVLVNTVIEDLVLLIVGEEPLPEEIFLAEEEVPMSEADPPRPATLDESPKPKNWNSPKIYVVDFPPSSTDIRTATAMTTTLNESSVANAPSATDETSETSAMAPATRQTSSSVKRQRM